MWFEFTNLPIKFHTATTQLIRNFDHIPNDTAKMMAFRDHCGSEGYHLAGTDIVHEMFLHNKRFIRFELQLNEMDRIMGSKTKLNMQTPYLLRYHTTFNIFGVDYSAEDSTLINMFLGSEWSFNLNQFSKQIESKIRLGSKHHVIYYIGDDFKIAWDVIRKEEKLDEESIPRRLRSHYHIYSRACVLQIRHPADKIIAVPPMGPTSKNLVDYCIRYSERGIYDNPVVGWGPTKSFKSRGDANPY